MTWGRAPKDSPIAKAFKQLEEETLRTLHSYSLNCDVEIYPRQTTATEPIPFLAVYLHQPKQQTWDMLSSKLYNLYKEHMSGDFFIQLNSFIEENMCVTITDEIKQEWDSLIEPKVKSLVELYNLAGYTLFSFRYRGSDGPTGMVSAHEAPHFVRTSRFIIPTIIIYGHPNESRSDWAEVVEEFLKVLRSHDLDSKYDIEFHPLNIFHCNTEKPWNYYHKLKPLRFGTPLRLTNGSGIGMLGQLSSATCGGFVMVTLENASGGRKVHKCFMTNHHVVAQGDQPWEPIKFDSNGTVEMQYPSGEDLKSTLMMEKEVVDSQKDALEKEKGTISDEEYAEQKKLLDERKEWFNDCRSRLPMKIGQVLVSSGLQNTVDPPTCAADEEPTPKAHPIMDWALVDCGSDHFQLNRSLKGRLSEDDIYRLTSLGVNPMALFGPLGKPAPATQIGKLEDEALVYMQSRSCEHPTFGEVNRVSLKRHSRPIGDRTIWSTDIQVHSIKMSHADFAKPGSSGAFIFSKEYQICGLLSGSTPIPMRPSAALVTPMEDILKAIKSKIEKDTDHKYKSVEVKLPEPSDL